MKKLFFFFVALFAITFTGCQKDSEILSTHNVSNVYKEPIIYVGGDIVYGDNWTGWIDPELVGGDKVFGEFYQGDANKKAEWIDIENVPVALVCNSDGNNCGILYEITDIGVRAVGYYSCD